MNYFIHKNADVQTTSIGDDTSIWQNVIILKGSNIGKNCNICANCFIESDTNIGNNVTLKNSVNIWDGITLQDNVFIGANVNFCNDKTPRSKMHREIMQTTVGQNASIGAGSTILPGLTIGKYSMIGAASLVTKDIPPYSVYYGNPASFKNHICRCGYIFKDDSLKCKECNLEYTKVDGRLELKND